jgi:hypothetical protein
VTPVESAADLAVGDAVEVKKYEYRGMPPKPRRGSVVRVGKAAAIIAFDHGLETIRYVKRVTAERGGRFRGTYKSDFHPLSKLSARDVWLSEEPNTDRIWNGGDRTVIAMATAVRNEIEAVVEDLRIYSEWLQREPKEEA